MSMDNEVPEIDFTDVRNLEVGNARLPLRLFDGILAEVIPEQRTKKDLTGKYNVVKLLFTDLNIYSTTEPWILPTVEVEFFGNKNRTSEFGIFGTTLGATLDMGLTASQQSPDSADYVPPAKRLNLRDCTGKRIGLVWSDEVDGRPPMHILWNGRARKEELQPSWEVYMVESIGQRLQFDVTPEVATASDDSATEDESVSNATLVAMKLLDGKTATQFNKEALGSDIVKGDEEVFTAVATPPGSEGSFLDTMVNTGNFKVVKGVYKRIVPAPVA